MSECVFLFITANDNEQEAFLNRLENQEEKTFKRGIVVTYGKFGCYKVIHFHSPYQGSESLMSIMNAIQSVKPDVVILVGIACGSNVKNKQQHYGDVLISKNIIDYDFHKDNEDHIELRGVKVPSGDILYSLFKQHSYKWKYEHNVNCYVGDIISSTVLVNNPQKKKEIFGLYNNQPVGYEMEGIGAFRVCRNNNIQQWIIIKGISDFGDGHKKDKYQIKASENAVSLCHYVFSQGGLNDIPKVNYDFVPIPNSSSSKVMIHTGKNGVQIEQISNGTVIFNIGDTSNNPKDK